MISGKDLPPELITARLANAVDVSGAMNNCFFNTYAAYLLSNKLPLPDDLFTPNPAKKGSLAEALKDTFKGPSDLDIFNAYHQQKYPGVESSEMLAEKSLVLGVLFREWFAKKLLENQENKQQLFSNDDTSKISFLKTIDGCRVIGTNGAIKDDRMLPIIEANREFFTNLPRTPLPNEKERFLDYWEKVGYKRYCEHLSKSGVALSYTDVEPVLIAQNVPYTLYSKSTGRIETQHAGDTTKPPLEFAISEMAGHYFLLKDRDTETSLSELQASLVQYRTDKEGELSARLCDKRHVIL